MTRQDSRPKECWPNWHYPHCTGLVYIECHMHSIFIVHDMKWHEITLLVYRIALKHLKSAMWFVFKLSNPMRLNTAGARKFQVYSSILQTPVWSKLHISSHRRKILWIDKQRGRSSIKVAKWYQRFWVVSFCYHHLFLRLTDTTKDRNYVWAMSHEFTWETQGSPKGHQQIWEGPCVCTKMTQGNFFGPSLKMEITDAQTGTVWHNLLFGFIWEGHVADLMVVRIPKMFIAYMFPIAGVLIWLTCLCKPQF